MRFLPVSYVSYRAVPAPPGAEDYGYFNYKLHENLLSEAGPPPLGLTGMTPEVVPLKTIMVNVPSSPTEDFKGAGVSRYEKTILRWVTVFRYPEGVSAEEADDWYVNVHAPEVMRQPGLTRFFSYRVLPPNPAVQAGVSSFLHPRSAGSFDWHRVSELWYEDGNGWVDSNLTSPPPYTEPPWATYHKYPFFQPGTDFGSTFILERPSDDWLRVAPHVYV